VRPSVLDLVGVIAGPLPGGGLDPSQDLAHLDELVVHLLSQIDGQGRRLHPDPLGVVREVLRVIRLTGTGQVLLIQIPQNASSYSAFCKMMENSEENFKAIIDEEVGRK